MQRRGTVNADGANIGHGSDSLTPDHQSKTTMDQELPHAPSEYQYASKEEIQQAIAELRQALPGKDTVTTDPDVLTTYGHSDNTYHPTAPHSVVVRPSSTEDVVKIVNIARKYRVPIVPYSGATSLEGHFSGVRDVPQQKGMLMDMLLTVDKRRHLP